MTEQKYSRSALRDERVGVYNNIRRFISKSIYATDNCFPISAIISGEKAHYILDHDCSRRARAHLVENPQEIQHKAGLRAI